MIHMICRLRFISNFHFSSSLFNANLFTLEPNNNPLHPSSYYALFIRVYVTDDLHTSTGWYPIVLTVKEDDGKNGNDKPDDGVKQNDRISKFSLGVSMTLKK